MNKLTQSIKQFLDDENGMGAVEYALIVAIMATAIVAGWGTLRTAISSAFTSVTGKITAANT